MEPKIPSFLLESESPLTNERRSKGRRFSVVDRTLMGAAATVQSVCLQAESANQKTFIHALNPKVKFIVLVFLAVVISLANNLLAQALILAFILFSFILARLNIGQVYRKIFMLAFIFGFLVIFPASLNVITPGKIIFNIISFDRSHQFWIYHIPQHIGFTLEGIQVVSQIFLRVLNSISIAMLIMLTTSFPAFIKSFKMVGVPDTFLMVITLAYKYIFILSRTIEETYMALKSRLVGNVKNNSLRKLISGRVFFIFKRSFINYENTYYAMVSRGYNGKITLSSSGTFQLKDYCALGIVLIFGIGILFI